MKVITQIETKRTIIRRFREKDAPDFAGLLQDHRVSEQVAFGGAHINEAAARQLLQLTIDSYHGNTPFLAFAIEHKESQGFMGACGMNVLSVTSIELFYALLPAYWGKGFATEVLEALTRYVFTELEFTQLEAFVKPDNGASVRVLLKNSFENRGLFRNINFAEPVFRLVKFKSMCIATYF
jgi:ribosomal-protein-alanine N-acetyltransferase